MSLQNLKRAAVTLGTAGMLAGGLLIAPDLSRVPRPRGTSVEGRRTVTVDVSQARRISRDAAANAFRSQKVVTKHESLRDTRERPSLGVTVV